MDIETTPVGVNGEKATEKVFVADGDYNRYRRRMITAGRKITGSVFCEGGFYVTTAPR